MRAGSLKLVLLVASALVAGLWILFVLTVVQTAHERGGGETEAPAQGVDRGSEPARGPAATPPLDAPARSHSREGASSGARTETADAPPDAYEVALRWSAVDLDAVRAAMPENLYWQMSAPTSDEDLIRWREEERARWNREYGKVLSGTATEDEIEAYYALRERISLDSIEFASHLLDRYRDTLPERDVGLLELAVKLHHARLQEIPRRLAEAHDRKQQQDTLREAWLADEEAFEKATRAE